MNEQCSIFDFVDDEYIYKINKPIRLIEFFAGVGAQHKALTNIKANFESYKICEWALPSIIGYNAIHLGNFNGIWDNETDKNKIAQFLYDKGVSLNYNEPATLEQLKRVDIERLRQCANSIVNLHNLVDISRVKGDTLEVVNKDKYTYMLTYSYPCITEDSLILTKDGYKQYKDLQVGEYVLTKSNTWQKIAKKFDNGIHKTYYLQGMGFENIHCTAKHKFYVREKYREEHKGIRKFKEPEFKQVKDITKNDYFGIPVIKEEIPFFTDNLDFWWLIGYYLGNGYLTETPNEISLTCTENKTAIICKYVENLMSSLDTTISEQRYRKIKNSYKITIHSEYIYNFILKYIGSRNSDKTISGNILMLPKEQLKSLFKGYLFSNGKTLKSGIKLTCVSRKLIYGLSSVINKLYHNPTKISSATIKKKNYTRYTLKFKYKQPNNSRAFYEDGYIWYPFTKLVEDKEEHVYNMEIENDHSYIVQGCISANCQDLSSAGKQMGQVEGSGTRSSLLWEVGRILKECKETDSLPQVLLMENVPNCHGTKNIKEWHKWLETLEQLGYKNFWKDLNSKDYEIPQTRNRCYMVSILKESDKHIVYNFPKKKKLKLLLKDLLESNVDEKYYWSDKMIAYCTGVNQKESKYNRGERFACALEKTNNVGIANTITTAAGQRALDNFIIDNTDTENLKTKLCNELIATGKVKENDVIRHNYSNSRLQDCGERNTEQNNISPTLDTRCDCLGVVVNTNNKRLNETLSNCTFINCNDGVVIPENTKKGYALAKDGDGVYINRPEQKRGTVQKGMIQTLKTSVDDIVVVVKGNYMPSKHNKECADTLQTTQKEGVVESTPVLLGGLGNKCNNDTQYHTQNRIYDDKMAVALNTGFNPYYYNNLRIRKLTPLECFRLMAFSDEDYYKMKQYLSDSKLYHCMGDSIVVKVLEYIFKELIEPSKPEGNVTLW